MNRKDFLTYLFFHGIKENKKTKNQYLITTSEKGTEYYIKLRPKQNTISFYYLTETWQSHRANNFHFQKKYYSYDLALKKILHMRKRYGT